MATFLLLPGAGGAGWYWHRVAPLLVQAGHAAIAVDFPAPDENAGLDAYADFAARAAAGQSDVIVVAQSMGGFTAPLVARRVSLRAVVLANAMIPLPHETAGAWWDNVKATEARTQAAKRGGYSPEFDLATYFLHDVPPDVASELGQHGGDEAKVAFETPCDFDAWPAVPIHVVIGADDRFFPADFQERIARERLGERASSIARVAGGHLAALAQPKPMAERLLAIASLE